MDVDRFVDPYLGASLWVCGMAIDMYTIYIVYREMVDVRTDIESARDEIQRTKTDIQKTKEEMVEIQMKVEDTAQRIEGIATDMYDRQGSTGMWDELKTTPATGKRILAEIRTTRTSTNSGTLTSRPSAFSGWHTPA